jgi:hypothetical protein
VTRESRREGAAICARDLLLPLAAVMEVPAAGWGAAAAGAGASASAAPPPVVNVGVWDQDVLISPLTSITCVKLPIWDKETCDYQGTKPAWVRLAALQTYARGADHLHIVHFASHQEQFLTALKARCNGRSPLNLRKPFEKDGVTPDVYFEAAPGQSTLG